MRGASLAVRAFRVVTSHLAPLVACGAEMRVEVQIVDLRAGARWAAHVVGDPAGDSRAVGRDHCLVVLVESALFS